MYPNLKSTNRYYAWYFIVYYFSCTDVLVTIITSFIIDAYQLSKNVRLAMGFLCFLKAQFGCMLGSRCAL